jgi:transcriptional regulator with XRE-family HTH domain
MGKMGRPRKAENVLARWIDDNRGGHRASVAEELGVSRVYLDRICREQRRPSLTLAAAIEKLTGGKIKMALWAEVAAHTKD